MTLQKAFRKAQRQGKAKQTAKTYVVKNGDSLWKICKQQLNDGTKTREIARLNGIGNPNLIYPGQVIKLE